jgi:RNA polymerase sigma factor (sigma-70 family)
MDGAFFEQHAPAVIRFFRGLVQADDVADLVQETFARWLESRNRMQPETEARAFVLGIARNVFYEYVRKLDRERRFDREVESMAAVQPGPSTIAAHRREHRMLAKALRRLPVELQVIVQLHYWDKLTAVELAAIEGISASGMRDRLMRARRLLARELAELERTTPLVVSTTSNGC